MKKSSIIKMLDRIKLITESARLGKWHNGFCENEELIHGGAKNHEKMEDETLDLIYGIGCEECGDELSLKPLHSIDFSYDKRTMRHPLEFEMYCGGCKIKYDVEIEQEETLHGDRETGDVMVHASVTRK